MYQPGVATLDELAYIPFTVKDDLRSQYPPTGTDYLPEAWVPQERFLKPQVSGSCGRKRSTNLTPCEGGPRSRSLRAGPSVHLGLPERRVPSS